MGAGPLARNEPESGAIPCQKRVRQVKRFTRHTLFWPLPQQGVSPLGIRATMGMGSRPPHAYDGLNWDFYKIIGNQWRCIKGINPGWEPIHVYIGLITKLGKNIS